MKKLVSNIMTLFVSFLLISTISHISADKIHAQENPVAVLPIFANIALVPNPTPINSLITPTPTTLIYQSNESWTKFKYHKLIAKTSLKYDLDPQLIYATIMTESEGNEMAYRYEPHLGEASLCMGQILISTARGLGFNGSPQKIYQPDICIDLIGKYYRNFLDQYEYLTPQQLARAYNSGSPWGRAVWGHISRFNSWYYEAS